MWPWEHVAFAYLLYSSYTHLVKGRTPRGDAVFVLGFAAVLPDLVDKPLSWAFRLFPSGYSVAHSAFVAPFVVLLAFWISSRYERPRLGTAFAIGYLSHLFGDVIYPFLTGEGLGLEKLLWPVVTLPPYETRYGLVKRFLLYFGEYLEQLLAGELGPLLLFEIGLIFFVATLWIYDGAPGTVKLRRRLTSPRGDL